jgi:hypothetical protein
MTSKQHVALITAGMAIVGAAALASAAPANGERRAAEIFRGMASKLAESKTVQVDAERQMDPVLAKQTGMPERATLDVAVMRPDLLRVRTVAPNDVRVLLADGQKVTVLDEKMNLYASVPVSGSIDNVSDALEKRFGFAPPLGELLSNDPQRSIGARTRSMAYGGETTIDGKRHHRLLLKGDMADAELTVSAEDQLPRSLVVTYKDTPGNPKLRFTLSGWRLDAPMERSAFAFDPPKGARQVEMVPVEALEPPGAGQEAAPSRQGNSGKPERRSR